MNNVPNNNTNPTKHYMFAGVDIKWGDLLNRNGYNEFPKDTYGNQKNDIIGRYLYKDYECKKCDENKPLPYGDMWNRYNKDMKRTLQSGYLFNNDLYPQVFDDCYGTNYKTYYKK